jgi:uncharacterized membrane protein
MSASLAPQPPPLVVWSRAVAAASLVALIALGVAWELWLAPIGRGTLALKVLPLAFCVAGVLKYRMQTYRWLSLLVWVYVAEGAVRAASDRGPGARCALAELLLCLLLFAACAAHVRLRLRGAKRPV